LCNTQRHHREVNGAKDAVLFPQIFCLNFTAYFRLQVLHPVHYFGAFCQMLLLLKALKIIFAKAALLWR
jgi:hypothetical protein